MNKGLKTVDDQSNARYNAHSLEKQAKMLVEAVLKADSSSNEMTKMCAEQSLPIQPRSVEESTSGEDIENLSISQNGQRMPQINQYLQVGVGHSLRSYGLIQQPKDKCYTLQTIKIKVANTQ